MPLQETSGTASYDAFGGGAAVEPVYIEQIFSTWLYTGNGSTQTITNGIDLAGKGGLTWIKSRNDTISHALFDTARGANNYIRTDQTGAQNSLGTYTDLLTSFNSNGFSLGADASTWWVNKSAYTYASWTFRKQPKFFDIVTYTGNGTNRTIAHNLGSEPWAIIVKRTDTTSNWVMRHNSLSGQYYMTLNSTAAQTLDTTMWNYTVDPTATTFSVGTNSAVNASGGTYVAYLFASNAGGFGLTGTDNVISCGSFTTNGSGVATVDLGYEPQFLLYKKSSGTGNWIIEDNMRGGLVNNTNVYGVSLYPNLSNAEAASGISTIPTATGFTIPNASLSTTYIYIAIRRGPMKTPTSGTSVFAPVATSVSTGTKVTTGFPVDLQLAAYRDFEVNKYALDRLRGVSTTEVETSQTRRLLTNTTGAEATGSDTRYWDNTGFQNSSVFASNNVVFWNFRRAPGFFDEVCYTGDATTPRTINHNLGVAPELIITKQRDTARSWPVRITPLGNSVLAFLNLTDASSTSASRFPVATYTGSTYVIGSDAVVNASGGTYVAYLFASCPGVSKVGSYTGNGSTQTINCGFTGGARFVLIKRTDSTGDWYVYDTARGMTTLTDPYLLLNSTAAESATLGSVTSVTGGFSVNSSILAAINANGGSYIFLAIA